MTKLGSCTKFHFAVSPVEDAQKAAHELTRKYGQVPVEEADVILALGGDGTTLHALQDAIRYRKPVFGLNFGFTGFLQNLYNDGEDLPARIAAAESISLSPLAIEAEDLEGTLHQAFAVNEIHVCNHNRAEGIYLKVDVDGQTRVPSLGADGLILSTTLGSTGYNKSARGPILPLGDDLLAFTPNNAFRPDRLRASVIRACPVRIEVLNPRHRRAELYADNRKIGTMLKQVQAQIATGHGYTLLFDRGYGLSERIMRSQFLTPAM